jgi:hypothetical protein
VQRQYSKFDDINSNGAVFCITTAPSPICQVEPRSVRNYRSHGIRAAYRKLPSLFATSFNALLM